MNNQQLIQVQRSIEQFFYKVRVNIALHNIMQSTEYADFKKQMRLAIENQILYFAKTEKVNQVVGAKKDDDNDLLQNLILLFPLLEKFIEKDNFSQYLHTAASKGADAAINVLGVEQNYDVSSRMETLLTNRVPWSMGVIDDTTVNWIASTLQTAMKQNLSSYDTAKLLRDEARVQALMRSETIAEQEAAWALGETQIDVYSEAGVEKKKLITSRDEGVCILCLTDEEAGQIPVKAAFPSGAVATPIHIRCRCFVLPVLNIPIRITNQ